MIVGTFELALRLIVVIDIQWDLVQHQYYNRVLTANQSQNIPRGCQTTGIKKTKPACPSTMTSTFGFDLDVGQTRALRRSTVREIPKSRCTHATTHRTSTRVLSGPPERSTFAQKQPVKLIFWTIMLLPITFCLFHTFPNSLTWSESIFCNVWALWKNGRRFVITWPQWLRLPTVKDWQKLFPSYSYS